MTPLFLNVKKEAGLLVYYMAPLEGVTTYGFRKHYHDNFIPFDKYFTPFLVPHQKRGFNEREKKEISSEYNGNLCLVPQILSNVSEGFLETVRKLREAGYREINLNLGCPSKTVVGKGRGSGFLAYPDKLDRFLDEIFKDPSVEISIKSRLGVNEAEEFLELIPLFNKYPIKEFILHPRTQKDFYGNTVNLKMFEMAYQEIKAPLIYNGDINTAEDAHFIEEKFPNLKGIMIGRGIVGNPCLLELIKGEEAISYQRIYSFLQKLLEEYSKVGISEKQVLHKMKEIFIYLERLFPDGRKSIKKIKKAEKFDRYQEGLTEIFKVC